jgi:xanthine dehydrogenase accessory factor
MHVTVVEERAELLDGFPTDANRIGRAADEFIAAREWQPADALLLVSRNYELDREALAAALRKSGIAYIGMIGSQRKVRRVFDDLRSAGITDAQLGGVYAPLGIDIGADSPAEIAISVLAEVMKVLRQRPGGHLRAARLTS